MDPNANLAEQVHLANMIADGVAEKGDAERLAELVLGMNEWLSRSGFLPKKWDVE